MKKNGFTLVELLAVVAVIAVLSILVLPNVISYFNNSRRLSFENELRQLYAMSESEYSKAFAIGASSFVYAWNENDTCRQSLKHDGRDLNYYIEWNEDGKVIKFYASDGSYQFISDTYGLTKENIKDAVQVTDTNKVTITCNGYN